MKYMPTILYMSLFFVIDKIDNRCDIPTARLHTHHPVGVKSQIRSTYGLCTTGSPAGNGSGGGRWWPYIQDSWSPPLFQMIHQRYQQCESWRWCRTQTLGHLQLKHEAAESESNIIDTVCNSLTIGRVGRPHITPYWKKWRQRMITFNPHIHREKPRERNMNNLLRSKLCSQTEEVDEMCEDERRYRNRRKQWRQNNFTVLKKRKKANFMSCIKQWNTTDMKTQWK